MINKRIDLESEPTLEFETYDHFELVIRAQDDPGLFSVAEFRINVIDINDNRPKILMPQLGQVFEINENNQKIQKIFEVKATDPDFTKSLISYELVRDIKGDWEFFTINTVTGEVTTNAVFDFETRREYNLRVKCTDNGVMLPESIVVAQLIDGIRVFGEYPMALTSMIDIRVVVVDLDDNEPEFGQFIINKNVSDNMQVGSVIHLDSTVAFLPLALDRDTLAENTNISYFIVGGNTEEKFSLNKITGELKLIEELERSLTNSYTLGKLYLNKCLI